MLSLAIFNFLIGTFGSLVLFLLGTFIEGTERFSAPFFVVAIGLICAVLSLLFGYLSTWIILCVYGLGFVVALFHDRKAIAAHWREKLKN